MSHYCFLWPKSSLCFFLTWRDQTGCLCTALLAVVWVKIWCWVILLWTFNNTRILSKLRRFNEWQVKFFGYTRFDLVKKAVCVNYMRKAHCGGNNITFQAWAAADDGLYRLRRRRVVVMWVRSRTKCCLPTKNSWSQLTCKSSLMFLVLCSVVLFFYRSEIFNDLIWTFWKQKIDAKKIFAGLRSYICFKFKLFCGWSLYLTLSQLGGRWYHWARSLKSVLVLLRVNFDYKSNSSTLGLYTPRGISKSHSGSN